MAKHRDFNDKDKFYATWTDAIQEWLSSYHSEFRLAWASATAIKIAAASGKRVALNINGPWRYRDSNYEVTVSGAAGTKDIYAVAVTANKFTGSSPTANDPDETDYNFELRVVTSGAEPTGVSTFRKVGEVDWSGSAITALRQTMGEIQGSQLSASALSNSGDLNWTREPSGAWVPAVKTGPAYTTVAAFTAAKTGGTLPGSSLFFLTPAGGLQAGEYWNIQGYSFNPADLEVVTGKTCKWKVRVSIYLDGGTATAKTEWSTRVLRFAVPVEGGALQENTLANGPSFVVAGAAGAITRRLITTEIADFTAPAAAGHITVALNMPAGGNIEPAGFRVHVALLQRWV